MNNKLSVVLLTVLGFSIATVVFAQEATTTEQAVEANTEEAATTDQTDTINTEETVTTDQVDTINTDEAPVDTLSNTEGENSMMNMEEPAPADTAVAPDTLMNATNE